MRAEFRHEIVLDLPVEEALPLFTPRGEERWVPGWRPRYISPTTGETRKEMLFTTDIDGETTIWACLEWQPTDGHARYLRITPGSRISIVDVTCQAEGGSRSRVRVSYEHFALTDDGKTHIEAISSASFEQSINGWADLIAARRPVRPYDH